MLLTLSSNSSNKQEEYPDRGRKPKERERAEKNLDKQEEYPDRGRKPHSCTEDRYDYGSINKKNTPTGDENLSEPVVL